jgi:hypothetical protein
MVGKYIKPKKMKLKKVGALNSEGTQKCRKIKRSIIYTWLTALFFI